MSDATRQMIDEWKRVSQELSLDISTYVNLPITKHLHVSCPVWVKNFGNTHGMLLFENYEAVQKITEVLHHAGYGYSVLPYDPRDHFDLESFKDILCDWGWAGPIESAPTWYQEWMTQTKTGHLV